ncbi:MAG: HDOD domain-containing protein [Steroidobacteraceae bacterium]
MSVKRQENIAGPTNKAAFAFIQDLALESSSGKIEIPSFPDVALRIRKVLADESCDTAQVAKVVSAEPAMAAKLLQMANSAALNPTGSKISELKSAIARIGFANVRTASLAYAMAQIRNAPALAPIRKPLNELWEHSVKVAAMAFVVARSWTRVNADRALLAGLMHGMGRVYILTRAVKHPDLFTDAAAYQQIVQDWHASIAKAVLESWDIAPDVVEAVEQFEQLDREGGEEADLTDVLAIANLLVSFHKDAEAMEFHLAQTTASKHMGLSREACQKVLSETQSELVSLHQALGG